MPQDFAIRLALNVNKTVERDKVMYLALMIQPLLAAVGYSLLYLLFGGGIGGAVVIFIIAKLLGK
jgi:hypothetical protein